MIHAALIAARMMLGKWASRAWEVAKDLPWQVWAAICGLILIVVIAFWISAVLDNALEEAAEKGAQEQREADLRAVIEQVERANDARKDNRNRTDDERRADCLRRSRTPQNC